MIKYYIMNYYVMFSRGNCAIAAFPFSFCCILVTFYSYHIERISFLLRVFYCLFSLNKPDNAND